ncbi:MAG: AtpZ/AtpI family protein, partial [Candidatus Uhrbacteria bacterium]|nr:AtpZ/AtpI family protein [Candidatus Uhrbacteria bacterium]
IGRAVDAVFGSFPLFFLIGILCAIISSTYIVYRRTSELLKEVESDSMVKNQEDRDEAPNQKLQITNKSQYQNSKK